MIYENIESGDAEQYGTHHMFLLQILQTLQTMQISRQVEGKHHPTQQTVDL